MASIEQNATSIQVIIDRLNEMELKKKKGSDLTEILSLTSSDHLLAVQGTELKKIPASNLNQSYLTVEKFTATAGQTLYTVGNAAVVDDGLWSVQVGSYLLNSTTGVTSFTDGGITINFTNGQITFNEALRLGESVIVKYN